MSKGRVYWKVDASSMGTAYEQVAAHEAGHAILALAMGRQLLSISMVEGKHPGAYLPGSPDATLMIDLIPASSPPVDGRLTYLVGVGGIAGEIVLEGTFHTPGAADDIKRLQGVGLDDTQIQGLSAIASGVIKSNLDLWKEIRISVLSGIEHKLDPLFYGAPINDLFKLVGKKFTDFAELDRVLPP